MFMLFCLLVGFIPANAFAANQDYIWLDELQIADSDRYTGNMGDSFIGKIGTRNGTVDINGNNYEHGLEAWIARWNYKDESSWAWCTYNLNGNYKSLAGTVSILNGSYNKSRFNTTLEIWGDDTVLYSQNLSSDMSNKDIDLNISGVKILKVSLYDNESSSGGTSFALGNFRIYSDKLGNEADKTASRQSTFQGHTYQVFNDSLTWEDAKTICEAKGGHLATITSIQEQEFIGQIIENGAKDFYWLGGTDKANEGYWTWVTGESWK